MPGPGPDDGAAPRSDTPDPGDDFAEQPTPLAARRRRSAPPSIERAGGPTWDAADDPFGPEGPLPEDPAELAALTRSLMGLTQIQQARLRERLHEPEPTYGRDLFGPGANLDASGAGGWSPFILTLDDDAYNAELVRLVRWVDGFLLPTFGREVTATRVWCRRWPEHPEAVARLHALWLAYGQHLDEEAGPAGMAVWIRDILDHALAQLRASDGPFAACATGPGSTNHRLLAPPEPTILPERLAGTAFAEAA